MLEGFVPVDCKRRAEVVRAGVGMETCYDGAGGRRMSLSLSLSRSLGCHVGDTMLLLSSGFVRGRFWMEMPLGVRQRHALWFDGRAKLGGLRP